MSLRNAALSALELASARDSTSAVHDLIARNILKLASGARISQTDYFNHSFIPDMVLKWEADGKTCERKVFIKLSVESRRISQDLELLESDAPLFVGLISEDEQQPRLPESAAVERSLVADTNSLDELLHTLRKDKRVRAATDALVRVGHGVVRADNAREISARVESAFKLVDHVQEDIPPARQAIQGAISALLPILDERGLIEVEQVFRTAWIRSGGDPIAFPKHSVMHGTPDDELRDVLLALLEGRSSVQPDSWTKYAGNLSPDQLGRVLRRPISGGRLNDLASALLPNWTAKWAWVESNASGTLPFFVDFMWRTNGRLFGLEAGDITIYFADDGRRFNEKSIHLPLPRLADNPGLLNEKTVSAASLVTAIDDIEYRLRRGIGQSVQERVLRVVTDKTRSDSFVKGISVQVPERDWEAEIDFQRGVIDVGNHPTPVSLLAELAFRYFSRTEPAVGAQLQKFLNV